MQSEKWAENEHKALRMNRLISVRYRNLYVDTGTGIISRLSKSQGNIGIFWGPVVRLVRDLTPDTGGLGAGVLRLARATHRVAPTPPIAVSSHRSRSVAIIM